MCTQMRLCHPHSKLTHPLGRVSSIVHEYIPGGGLQAWDLATAQCQHTLKHHKGKVQAVAWNPAEAAVLLSGGFDKVIAMVCSRSDLAQHGILTALLWTQVALL